MKTILACLFVALSVVAPVNVATAVTCETLIAVPLQDGVITSAVSVPGPRFTGPDGRTYQEVQPFCRVTATLTPTSDSLINVEVWMPISGWNLRFEGTGNGGYAGNIALDVPEMIAAVNAGRAVAATDMGTAPSTNNDADALVGHPEKWIDFGYRATHLMTVAAKQIVSTFYGQGPRYSYFHGCSTGGQQALMEAQRFPDDYDGILGGAPANNRTHVHTNAVWVYKQFHATPASYIPATKFDVINQAVLAQCRGQDGGAKTDAFLTDPRDCKFDPATLA